MSGFWGLLFWWAPTGGAPVPLPPVCVHGLRVVNPRVVFGEPEAARVCFAPILPVVRFGEPEAC